MFKKILVPLDGSPLAENALDAADAIARVTKADVDLILVHAPTAFPVGALSEADLLQWHGEDRYLERQAGMLQQVCGTGVSHVVPRGDAVEMIVARARDVDASLIVMTSHGRTGMSRVWMGSVADGIARTAEIPVLMLRTGFSTTDHNGRPRFQRVMVLLDGSPSAAEILPAAEELARCSNGKLLLVRVVQPVPLATAGPELILSGHAPEDEAATHLLVEESKRELAALARRVTGLEVETHVLGSGHVAKAIIDFAKLHDVHAIALSTHGRGMSRLVVGSIADRVIRGTRVPLLILRPAKGLAERELLDQSDIEAQLGAVAGG